VFFTLYHLFFSPSPKNYGTYVFPCMPRANRIAPLALRRLVCGSTKKTSVCVSLVFFSPKVFVFLLSQDAFHFIPTFFSEIRRRLPRDVLFTSFLGRPDPRLRSVRPSLLLFISQSFLTVPHHSSPFPYQDYLCAFFFLYASPLIL